MKIGILTQPLHVNYGGLLQNFALQQVLKKEGYEVDTIDWHFKRPFYRYYLGWCKWCLFKIANKKVEKPRYQLSDSESLIISGNTKRFIDRYLSICPMVVHEKADFTNIPVQFNYDAYIVGSDQVWRPSYNSTALAAMFLDFCEGLDVKRIAYAASFGSSNWDFSPGMTKKCAKLAKKFNLITVREESGVNLCREFLGVDANHVLDPTMLLSKEEYVRLVEAESAPKSNGELFHYILDPSNEKKIFIEKVARSQGLKAFTIMPKCQAENRTRTDVKNHIEDCVFPSVTSWLRGFLDAKMVIVDSFHGAAFSIIFNKPFWVLANTKRGNARFESLLGMFGLEDRMITTEILSEDFFDCNKMINWEKVNEIRDLQAKKSMNCLKGALL